MLPGIFSELFRNSTSGICQLGLLERGNALFSTHLMGACCKEYSLELYVIH